MAKQPDVKVGFDKSVTILAVQNGYQVTLMVARYENDIVVKRLDFHYVATENDLGEVIATAFKKEI